MPTPRQLQVLKLRAFGWTHKQIAAKLGIALSTVDSTYRRGMDNLLLTNHRTLVVYGVRQGWFDELRERMNGRAA